jgi:hypothetical protein
MLYHPLKSSETSKQKQKQTKPRRGFAMFVFFGALWIHPLQPHLQVQKTYAKPLPSIGEDNITKSSCCNIPQAHKTKSSML